MEHQQIFPQSEHLNFRPWVEGDAETLYKLASNPHIGPRAGWPVHTSIENSREIIQTVLGAPETYALILKESEEIVGSIGLIMGECCSAENDSHREGEIGYWITEEHWGEGLATEAVKEMVRYAFENLGLDILWCAYYDDNFASKRVQEKSGFIFHHTERDKPCELMHDIRTEHISILLNPNSFS